ncbi:MAG: type II restriction endonuclease, partial [Longimicrobiales bacterium]
LKALLGTESHTEFPTTFIHLGSEADEQLEVEARVTWYDARAGHPTRSEYRLYYPSNAVTAEMHTGDLLVLARTDDRLLWIVAAAGSSAESQVSWLFALEEVGTPLLSVKSIEPRPLDPWIAISAALESIGVHVPPPQPETSSLITDRIKLWAAEGLPATAELSRFARESIVDFDQLARDDPDQALVDAMEREEWLFREVERSEVEGRIERGFSGVDDFLGYSLSVQNRRKARAGLAFEHHIAAILEAGGVHFERGIRTENDAKPDFVLPSGAAYHDPGFPVDRLGILGAKRTCKDRWRQVLTEAERVLEKHLLTVEPSISRNQTDEMDAHSLTLVVPRSVASSYGPDQRTWLSSVADFIQLRRALQ